MVPVKCSTTASLLFAITLLFLSGLFVETSSHDDRLLTVFGGVTKLFFVYLAEKIFHELHHVQVSFGGGVIIFHSILFG